MCAVANAPPPIHSAGTKTPSSPTISTGPVATMFQRQVSAAMHEQACADCEIARGGAGRLTAALWKVVLESALSHHGKLTHGTSCQAIKLDILS